MFHRGHALISRISFAVVMRLIAHWDAPGVLMPAISCTGSGTIEPLINRGVAAKLIERGASTPASAAIAKPVHLIEPSGQKAIGQLWVGMGRLSAVRTRTSTPCALCRAAKALPNVPPPASVARFRRARRASLAQALSRPKHLVEVKSPVCSRLLMSLRRSP